MAINEEKNKIKNANSNTQNQPPVTANAEYGTVGHPINTQCLVDELTRIKQNRKLAIELKKSEFIINLYTRKTMAYFIGIIGLLILIILGSIWMPKDLSTLGALWISGASIFTTILGIVNSVDKKSYLNNNNIPDLSNLSQLKQNINNLMDKR